MAIYEGATIMPVFGTQLTPERPQTIRLEMKITEVRG
jgi:hypothetical protein